MNMKRSLKRLTAFLLCAVLLVTALPFSLLAQQSASASSWATPYVDQLRDWGVLKGDGSGGINAGEKLTRARMVAMLNRAFGLRTTGPIPFTDVQRKDWYYDDIAIGYTEGIFNGTSPTKANPNGLVTREQALALLGRCLRLDQSVGEVTEFTDGRQFSTWAAPYVRSSVLAGLINGFSDGSFRPKSSVTVGEMAKMLSAGIGNLINTPGTYPIGGFPPNGVFGNLTINTNGVTLRDVTIAGDLYLTGGVGLGDVILDNVTVLGRIVIAGGGNSESGEASIILNNVEAHKLIIDPATGQFVSVRAVGSTNIPETQVSCNAYIQDDVRDNSKGLQQVILESQPGANFVVAGNMKDVINKTPDSTLTVGDTGTGSVSSVTVDEHATNSTLKLEINAVVDQVHLDTGAQVIGKGDIGQLNVNEDGSVSEILPDKIVVRPGVITEVAGIPDVDSEKAKELSSDPNLIAGYPKVRNIAPTSADGIFSVNKTGTLYWALTTAAKGPLNDSDAESLIHPSYGSGFLQNGTMEMPLSKTEQQVSFTGLNEGGTYYVSAVLEDAHGRRSPVKSQEFTTPDGSVPAMMDGFPTITDRTPTRNSSNQDTPYYELVDVQATVMASKSCDLYYVLLPAGSTQPQTSEFLSHSFADPFGYGRLNLIKNAMDSFKVNEIDLNLDGVAERLGELEENTDYDLYLWLTDADGTQSSNIIKQTITTKDITPPHFLMDPAIQTGSQATSIEISNSVDENSTVYWVAVKTGATYPVKPDSFEGTNEEFLHETYAKLQLVNGLYGLKSGKLTAQANKEFKINITGLERETAYDIYYLAEDAAGNYSDPIEVFRDVHTLDESAPTARQEFEEYPEDSPNTPYADSSIRIVFNESIRYRQPSNSDKPHITNTVLLDMYKAIQNAVDEDAKKTAQEEFVTALSDMIILLDSNGKPVPVYSTGDKTEVDWVVDYNYVTVYQEEDDSSLVVNFPTNADPAKSALNLQSGATYQFQLQNITDNAAKPNLMGKQTLPLFTVVSAEALLDTPNFNELTMRAFETGDDGEIATDDDHKVTYIDHNGVESDQIPLDMYFTLEPNSTRNASDGISWDMLLWFDVTCDFQLFTRKQGTQYWTPVGGKQDTLHVLKSSSSAMGGVSVAQSLASDNLNPFHDINDEYKTGGLQCGLDDTGNPVYEYGIFFTSIAGNTDRTTFSQLVTGRVTVVTGSASNLLNLASKKDLSTIDRGEEGITNISKPEVFLISRQFEDKRAPDFIANFPQFDPTAEGVTMRFYANRPGSLFYVISKATARDVSTDADLLPMERNAAGDLEPVSQAKLDMIKESMGSANQTLTTSSDPADAYRHFDYPDNITIINPSSILNPDIKYPESGGIEIGQWTASVEVEGLAPETDYYVYFVTKGVTDVYSDVLVYKFRTKEVVRPIITTNATNALATINSSLDDTHIEYKLIPYDDNMRDFLKQQFSLPGNILEEEFNYYNTNYSSSLKMEDDNGTLRPMKFSSENFTVLDALLENIMINGKSTGSLFDFCASDTLRSQVITYIRSSGGDTTSVGRDSGYIDKSSDELPVQCDTKWPQIKDSTIDYCMIVFGYCGNGENQSNFAFSGARPIAVPKERIKMYWDASSLIYSWKTKADGTIDTSAATVNGSLTIFFTDALHSYNLSSTGAPSRSPIYLTNDAADSESIANYISIPNTTMKLDYPTSGNSTSPLRSLTIDFKDSSGAMTVRLRDNMYAGSNSDPQPTGFSVTVRPERALDPANPNDSCGVTITTSPAAWIATDRLT